MLCSWGRALAVLLLTRGYAVSADCTPPAAPYTAGEELRVLVRDFSHVVPYAHERHVERLCSAHDASEQGLVKAQPLPNQLDLPKSKRSLVVLTQLVHRLRPSASSLNPSAVKTSLCSPREK